jgi:hypothetical protein
MEFSAWNLAFMVLSGIIVLACKLLDVPKPLKTFLMPLAGFVFVSTALSAFFHAAWS